MEKSGSITYRYNKSVTLTAPCFVFRNRAAGLQTVSVNGKLWLRYTSLQGPTEQLISINPCIKCPVAMNLKHSFSSKRQLASGRASLSQFLLSIFVPLITLLLSIRLQLHSQMTFHDNSRGSKKKSKKRKLALPPPVMFSASVSFITPKMAENSELRCSVVLTFLFLYYGCVCLNMASKLLFTKGKNEIPC